ncbi:MAG: HNH endonuclease family protein, partial [Actinomycetota bacterium]
LPVPSTTVVSAPTTTTTAAVPVAGSSVLDLLASIRIVPEYTVGYDRDLFPHWKDLDGDGCDTRKEVLIRDSRTTAVVGSSCTVSSGTWQSPYDGVTWTNPSDVDIDHVVALNEAWQSGAYAWSTQQRTNYANDLTDDRTLLAVTDSVNQSKSDKDPTEWLPPLATYRCTYLAHWVSVKARWSLTMDQAEHAVVKSALASCTNQTAPAAPALPTASPAVNAPTTAPAASTTGGRVAGFVSPGAFCTPFGATGVSDKGVAYTCKPSETESRNRWRR